jgi:Ca2+-transporting ATPase
VLASLETTLADGLSDEEVKRRLERFGPNRLERARPVSVWKILRDQLTSVVVLLLAAAAGVSLLLGDYAEAAAIAAVLVLNAVIGFVTEFRARRAMEALLHFDLARAVVRRSGRIQVVDAHTIVPGDILELTSGQAVPADARLVNATELRTSEAALTGESLPISKHADAALDPATPLADRTNMVYKGTTVVAGMGHAVVIGTGIATELGRIGALMAAMEEERTPLERRLDALGHRLVWLALAVAAIVAALEAFQGTPINLVVETGIALAVAAVPEALPAVATIALAVGLHRMARRQALVRRLPSVEALGSTTVVCTDKTRTLTSGDMSVVCVWTADAEFNVGSAEEPINGDDRLRRALEIAVLASRQQGDRPDGQTTGARDPVDAAILAAGQRLGIDHDTIGTDRRPVHTVPFSSERKLMATFSARHDQTIAYVKGAPHRLLDLSDRRLTSTGEAVIDEPARNQLVAVNNRMAGRGQRVLGLASGRVQHANESSLRGLTFVGFIGLMDPPAPGVRQTIGRLRAAGLRTIMVTGDQRATAQTVGRELGLLSHDDQVIDGRELHALSQADLVTRLANVAAFTRVAPEDKLAIVEALQGRGEIVAMLGDGVNDAPALKKADVGVAMGKRGTDVAKEAAAIVLQDDRFETVAAAVEEGRVIYDNIRKFVFYLFSCNLAEILVLLIAGLTALPPPLMPLQILWLNMVTDTLPALALAMEPADPNVMRRPPRHPSEALLSRAFLRIIGFYGGLMTGSTLAAFLWALRWSPANAMTISFMTLALAQIFHLGNARSPRAVITPQQVFANPYALAALAASVGLQLMAVQVSGLRALLRLTTLDFNDWAVAVGAAAVPAVAGQIIKLARRRT